MVERVTLKDVMPDASSVLRNLFTEITIQEPAFDSTVILYRRVADSQKAEQQDEKAPLKHASAVSTALLRHVCMQWRRSSRVDESLCVFLPAAKLFCFDRRS